MTKKLLLIVIATVLLTSLVAEARMREQPVSFKHGMKLLSGIDRKVTARVDVPALLRRDSIAVVRREAPGPYRFAEALTTNYTTQNSGTWTTMPDGSRLWRIRIFSENALNLNLAFTRFDLPEGAKVWLYNAAGDYVEGPYTAANRNDQGQLWTPIVPGNEVVVELYVPPGASPEPNLEIGRVNYGYRDITGMTKSGGDKSGDCNIDVVCPAGNAWRDQIRSVARYSIGGTGFCTGQLVNNTDLDFTPYFLSAFHCGVDATNAGTCVFYWNFESPHCGDHGGGSLADNQVGALYRAGWASSDFLLIELQNDPDPDYNVFFTGWDAGGSIPGSSVCIHHPSADEKSISFDNDPLTSTAYFSNTADATANHWRVGAWDAGTTEPGSSGSCIYNTANKLCVGQLHGGLASCDDPDDPDWYGKFSVSWNGGGTAATRLRDWLNPSDDGTMQLAGADPPTAGGPVMRLQTTFLDYGDVELGFAYTKAIVIYNDGDAPLVVTVSNASGGDPDLPHWSELHETADEMINVGAPPLVLTQVYEPLALGLHSIDFQVSSNDPVTPIVPVMLTGRGVAPTPINSVLILDRSGSMSETAGERRKIDAMRDAADLYIHLLRQDISSSGTGDQIGFVKYNHSNSVYLPLDHVDDPAVPGSHMATAEDLLSNASLADNSRIKPTGSTAIGEAMFTAAGLFTPMEPDNRHVMVVLTDGIENSGARRIPDAVGPIQAADPELQMYSVGVGNNIEPDKLQLITNVGNGYHQVSDDLSGTSLFDLETFYFKIFANATGMDLVVDPTYAVQIRDSLPINVARARMTSSDRKAVFVAFDSPALRKYYRLDLVAPNGDVITTSSVIGGVTVHIARRHTYTIYKVMLPDPDVSSEFLGDWVLRLTPFGRYSANIVQPLLEDKTALKGFVSIDPSAGFVPIGFAAAVASNYRMQVEVLPDHFLPGASVLLTATLTDRGWPTLDANIVADVMAPGVDLVQTIRLHDDGLNGDAIARDGTWSGRFSRTGQTGSYRFIFRSRGHNNNGELAAREASRFVSLGTTSPGPTIKPVKYPFSISLHAGAAIPTGTFDSYFDPGLNILIDFDYHISPIWSLVLFVGYNGFESGMPAGSDMYMFNVSLNGRYHRSIARHWKAYIEAGPGIYAPEYGSTEFGSNAGLGLNFLLNSQVILEIGGDYHTIPDPDWQFIHAHGGVIYRF